MEDNRNQQELPELDASRANDESVIRVHAQIRRTPIAGSPIAFFTTIALIIVFVFGWFYFRRYFAGGDSHAYVADREQIAAMEAYLNRPKEPAGPVVVDGGALYAQQCSACHQANGQGLAGAFPPLAGSEWVTTGDGELPIKILLSGLGGEITVKGQTYNGAMPAFGAVFDDAEIAAVVNYIRGSWDNEASEVTAEQVAAVRADTGSRGTWTAAELQSHFE
ncbi:cytochrome c [Pelagicoccus sp. SDUM812003]|uniref:c-type cytochrome n=1 Tax=Pelagicoccus sp. SDUM812003 TaxID=3041267 RepID=UPI0028100152|nr:cytochrome c [Pelagicoccus sp. SDUM812003]MDQ8202982.1 cytochrome c [Pelagicoccus sp. SDUM812003]